MSIRNVVTRGYGAGASIPFVVTRGYTIGVAAVTNASADRTSVKARDRRTIVNCAHDDRIETEVRDRRIIITNAYTANKRDE